MKISLRGIFRKFYNSLVFFWQICSLLPWRVRLAHIGLGTKIDRHARIKSPTHVWLGSNCHIRPYAQIHGTYKGSGNITFGDHCSIGEFAMVVSFGGEIVFGHHCSVNPHCVIYGHGNLSVGNYVRIAAHTVIIPANHVVEDKNTPISLQGLTCQGITIEDNVWIGAGVTIIDGVNLGSGAVIGAGSVITKDVPPNEIWAGVPARCIRVR